MSSGVKMVVAFAIGVAAVSLWWYFKPGPIRPMGGGGDDQPPVIIGDGSIVLQSGGKWIYKQPYYISEGGRTNKASGLTVLIYGERNSPDCPSNPFVTTALTLTESNGTTPLPYTLQIVPQGNSDAGKVALNPNSSPIAGIVVDRYRLEINGSTNATDKWYLSQVDGVDGNNNTVSCMFDATSKPVIAVIPH